MKVVEIIQGQKPYVLNGTNLGLLYHGGFSKIKTINPAQLQSRDYGFYGRGFYTAIRPDLVRGYGGRITRLRVAPGATVLRAAIAPWEADPQLIRDIVDSIYQNGIAAVQARGKEAAFQDQLHKIETEPLAWKIAVDQFATQGNYDIVYYSDAEIVVKNLSVLSVI